MIDINNTNKRYKIIYADPPWVYRVWSKNGESRSASSYYKTLSLNDIKNISVQDIAERDSVLFMWATFPNLKEAFELGEAWGFNYKTVAFTWVKKNKNGGYFFGMGYYTRANAEICLLFTRGKPLKRKSRSVRQICDARIREHSRKPDEIRERIIDLFGNLPRIELFAREQAEGWDVFGNETNKFSECELTDWYEKQGAMNDSFKKRKRI